MSAYPPDSSEDQPDSQYKDADIQDEDADENDGNDDDASDDEDEDEDESGEWEDMSDSDQDDLKASDAAFKHEEWRNDKAAPAGSLDLYEYGISIAKGKVTLSSHDMVDAIYTSHSHASRRYNLEAIDLFDFDLSLLYVNRQINAESTPIFYGGINFVPDCDSVDAIRFFKQLPTRAIENITTLTVSELVLLGDDGPSRNCWSGEVTKPLTKGCPAMITPMGAFIATSLPKLTDIYLYTPVYGDEDWYCIWAPAELGKLLCHGKLQRLHYVFMGQKAAEVLSKGLTSQKGYEWLFSDNLPGYQTAKYEFAAKHSFARRPLATDDAT